jgi:hypothetical protein
MFFRTKKAGPRTYLQIVENHRIGGKIQQRVIATLGRLEELQSSGQLDALLCSGARFAEAARSDPGATKRCSSRTLFAFGSRLAQPSHRTIEMMQL